jgi:hypothetical protein
VSHDRVGAGVGARGRVAGGSAVVEYAYDRKDDVAGRNHSVGDVDDGRVERSRPGRIRERNAPDAGPGGKITLGK